MAYVGMLERLRGVLRRRVARRRLARPSVETSFGFNLKGPKSMQAGTFEVEETTLVRSFLERCDQFVNVGANIGYYCCFAQSLGVKTVAFEPIASNLQILLDNMQSNGWGDRISVLPVAVGESSGVIEIYGEGTGASVIEGWARNPRSIAQKVPMVRLDDFVKPAAQTVILIDVEGFELPVLRGAQELITADVKPIWIVEIALREHQPVGRDVNPEYWASFEIMKQAGYAVYEANAALTPVAWADIKAAPLRDIQNIGSGSFVFVDAQVDPATLRG